MSCLSNPEQSLYLLMHKISFWIQHERIEIKWITDVLNNLWATMHTTSAAEISQSFFKLHTVTILLFCLVLNWHSVTKVSNWVLKTFIKAGAFRAVRAHLVLTLLTSCRGVRSLLAVLLWQADGHAERNVGKQRASMATPDRTWGC